MSYDTPQNQLLMEIDARQDEVLQQLDDLNLRVEDLLKQWTAAGINPAAVAE